MMDPVEVLVTVPALSAVGWLAVTVFRHERDVSQVKSDVAHLREAFEQFRQDYRSDSIEIKRMLREVSRASYQPDRRHLSAD